MKLKGYYEVVLKFETTEDVPEGYESVAQEFVGTQDFTKVPVRDNFAVMLESEFGAENVELIEFKVRVEELPTTEEQVLGE